MSCVCKVCNMTETIPPKVQFGSVMLSPDERQKVDGKRKLGKSVAHPPPAKKKSRKVVSKPSPQQIMTISFSQK